MKVEARSLIHYQRDIEELGGFAQNLSVMVKQLKDHLNINHSSLKDAVYSLMNEVIRAQDYLNKNGPRKLLEVSLLLTSSSPGTLKIIVLISNTYERELIAHLQALMIDYWEMFADLSYLISDCGTVC